jgi:hypothetical protein
MNVDVQKKIQSFWAGIRRSGDFSFVFYPLIPYGMRSAIPYGMRSAIP